MAFFDKAIPASCILLTMLKVSCVIMGKKRFFVFISLTNTTSFPGSLIFPPKRERRDPGWVWVSSLAWAGRWETLGTRLWLTYVTSSTALKNFSPKRGRVRGWNDFPSLPPPLPAILIHAVELTIPDGFRELVRCLPRSFHVFFNFWLQTVSENLSTQLEIMP